MGARILALLLVASLSSCALLTGPIDRMVARQELSLSDWEARQIQAQTDVNLSADERLEAQKDAWADYRRESSENFSEGFTELKAGIETIGEAAVGVVTGGAGQVGYTLMEQVLGAITGITGAVGVGYGVKRAAAAQVNRDRDAARTRRGEPTA